MATVQELEVRCGTCGYWMPAAAPDPTIDASAMLGVVMQCRKCLQRTTAQTENMRVKLPDGRYEHWHAG